jgi:Double zinc ribbon
MKAWDGRSSNRSSPGKVGTHGHCGLNRGRGYEEFRSPPVSATGWIRAIHISARRPEPLKPGPFVASSSPMAVFFDQRSGRYSSIGPRESERSPMRCAKCEFESPAGMKFCGKCTTALRTTCPNCSFENPTGFDFCGQCAAALHRGTEDTNGKSAGAKPLAAVRVVAEASPMLEGERKTVTALFCGHQGLDGTDGGPRPRGGALRDRSGAASHDRSGAPATTVTSCSRPVTASSRCLGRRWRRRIIRNARSMRRCGCSGSCASTGSVTFGSMGYVTSQAGSRRKRSRTSFRGPDALTFHRYKSDDNEAS